MGAGLSVPAGALRVAVLGALGRMGRQVCQAVAADATLELVAAVDPLAPVGPVAPVGLSGPPVQPEREAAAEAGAEAVVDFTVPSAALGNALWCAARGLHCVVGTTGLDSQDLGRLRDAFAAGPANCLVAPNFAIGAVLMMRFAELAAPWFEGVEVVELHHAGKLDAPSGTARLTAERVAAAREDAGQVAGPGRAARTPAEGAFPVARGEEVAPGVRVHSVRLPGLVAHQEVIFGTAGEVLTLRHDSLDRASFMPGALLAVKRVGELRGLTVGLDSLLGL